MLPKQKNINVRPRKIDWFKKEEIRLEMEKYQSALVRVTCEEGIDQNWKDSLVKDLEEKIDICQETLGAEKDIHWRWLVCYPNGTKVNILRGKYLGRVGEIDWETEPAYQSGKRRFKVIVRDLMNSNIWFLMNEDGFQPIDSNFEDSL